MNDTTILIKNPNNSNVFTFAAETDGYTFTQIYLPSNYVTQSVRGDVIHTGISVKSSELPGIISTLIATNQRIIDRQEALHYADSELVGNPSEEE
jgi:hypothetical protein